MVDGKTSWYGSTNTGTPTSKPYWVWPRILKVNNEDTITYSNFLLDGRIIDPNNCNSFGWDEAYFTYYWSTNQGETYNRYETLGLNETTTLLGSKINGKVTGTLVVPSVPKTAQGWKLFNKNQKSMYLQRYDNALKVESFLVDSVRSDNGDEYYYFNSMPGQFGECYPQFKSFIKKDMPYTLNEDKIDSLVLSGDSVLFISDIQSKIDTFIFKPYSEVGTSWKTNNLTIKCIAKIQTNVFGFTDSLKAFQVMTVLYDTMVFVLSKSYGFLKFWPLNEFIKKSNDTPRKPYFEFIGFKNGTTGKGYQQPDFSDYFHLKVGDVLYWKDEYDPYSLPDPTITNYYIDTIKSVYISADSVHYDFKRTYIKDGKVKGTDNESTYYLRKKEGIIVEGSTSEYGLKSDEINNLAYYLDPLELIIENNDTITIATLSNDGLSLKDDCSTYVIIDYDGVDKYSTKEGFIFHGSYTWGTHELKLIGSIIDNKESGITDVETSISNSIEEVAAIYPNPVHDILNLKLSKPGNTIELYDINNKLLFNGSYTEQLDLSSLNPGVYLLRVNYNDSSKFIRIVKQ